MSQPSPVRKTQYTNLDSLLPEQRKARRTRPVSFKRPAAPTSASASPSTLQRRQQEPASPGSLAFGTQQAEVPKNNPLFQQYGAGRSSERRAATLEGVHNMGLPQQPRNSLESAIPRGDGLAHPTSSMDGSFQGMTRMSFSSYSQLGRDGLSNQSTRTQPSSLLHPPKQNDTMGTSRLPPNSVTAPTIVPCAVIDLTLDSSDSSDLGDSRASAESDLPDYNSSSSENRNRAPISTNKHCEGTNIPTASVLESEQPQQASPGGPTKSISRPSQASHRPIVLPLARSPQCRSFSQTSASSLRSYEAAACPAGSSIQPEELELSLNAATEAHVTARVPRTHLGPQSRLDSDDLTILDQEGYRRRIPRPHRSPNHAGSSRLNPSTSPDMMNVSHRGIVRNSRSQERFKNNRSSSSQPQASVLTTPVLPVSALESAKLPSWQKKSRENRAKESLEKRGLDIVEIKKLEPELWGRLVLAHHKEQDNLVRQIVKDQKNKARAKKYQSGTASSIQREQKQGAPELDCGGHIAPAPPHPTPPALSSKGPPSQTFRDPRLAQPVRGQEVGNARSNDFPVASAPRYVDLSATSVLDSVNHDDAHREYQAARLLHRHHATPVAPNVANRSQVADSHSHAAADTTRKRPPETLVLAQEQQGSARATPGHAIIPEGGSSAPLQKNQNSSTLCLSESLDLQQTAPESRAERPVLILPPPRTSSSPDNGKIGCYNGPSPSPAAVAYPNTGSPSAAPVGKQVGQPSTSNGSSTAGEAATLNLPKQTEQLGSSTTRNLHMVSSLSRQTGKHRPVARLVEGDGRFVQTPAIIQKDSVSEPMADSMTTIQQPPASTLQAGNILFRAQNQLVPSLAERLRQERLSIFDSDALDAAMYVQSGINFPANLKIPITAFHQKITLPPWAQLHDPYANPYIQGMHPPLQPMEQAAKDAEIAARGGRKFWFGRVAARRRFRIEKDRRIPQWLRPRIAYRPRDIGFLKEHELPEVVKKNAAWMRHWNWLRSQKREAHAIFVARKRQRL